MSDPLTPDTTLLCKLGSIAVHVEEGLSAQGHHFDWAVVKALLDDEQVKHWIKQMDELALVPRKR